MDCDPRTAFLRTGAIIQERFLFLTKKQHPAAARRVLRNPLIKKVKFDL
jgi:hypothetical protein